MQVEKKVFICYSSHDKRFVDALATNLKSHGLDVWYDKWIMRVGDSLQGRIAQGIEESKYMVIVISEDSLRSKWVKHELTAALAKELEMQDVFILPVFHSGQDEMLPTFLKDKIYADFRVSYNVGFAVLLNSITGVDCTGIKFKRGLGEREWKEVWSKFPESYHWILRDFIQYIDNPEGLAFIESYSKTKSGYEAMCETDHVVSSYMGLTEWGLITSVVDACWPSEVARNYKIAARLTQLGYRIAEQMKIEELNKINFESLPSS